MAYVSFVTVHLIYKKLTFSAIRIFCVEQASLANASEYANDVNRNKNPVVTDNFYGS